MGRIFCVVEDYDTILKCRRPNGISKTWGLKEFKKLEISRIVDRSHIYNSHNRTLKLPHFTNIFKEISKENKPDYINNENWQKAQIKECGNFWYIDKNDIGNKKFLYVIHIYGSEYFDQHNEAGLKVISEDILSKVRKNQGHIIIFFVNEPEPWTGNTVGGSEPALIDRWRKDAGLPPYSVSYFTGNYKLIQNSNLLTPYKVNIKPFSAFLYTFAYFVLAEKALNFKYNPIDSKNIFLSYMRLPRIHRWLLYGELIERNVIDRGLLSFGLNQNNSGISRDELKNIMGHELVSAIVERGEQYISDPTLDFNLADSPFHEYDYTNTFLSIVSETSSNNSTIFLSEKIWKPIIAGHPFIVNGNPGTVKILKDLGYKTFSKWWSEEYDNEVDLKKRIKMIGAIVERLSKYSTKELKAIRQEMEPILVYNKKLISSIINEKITARGDLGDWREDIESIYSTLNTGNS